MRLLYTFLLSFFLWTQLSAQDRSLAIGQWRTHLPYSAGAYVSQSPDKVYFSTEEAILIIDKEDQSIDFLDKVNGLSGTQIEIVQFHPGTNTLVVVYENAAIDLVRADGQVATLNQIPNFDNFVGEKTIANVEVDSDTTILLAANFGLSRLNVNREEFVWTTFTGVAVQDAKIWRDQIHIATSEGVYALAQSNRSPEDFSQWTLLGQEQGLPAFYSTSALEVFADRLYLNIDGELVAYDGSNRQLIQATPDGFALAYILAGENQLFYGYSCLSGCQGQAYYVREANLPTRVARSCIGLPTSIVEDERGRIWFGDRWRSFRMLPSVEGSDCDYTDFNSPFSTENKEMAIRNNELWLASGGVTQTFNYRFLDQGITSFIDGRWRTFSRNNNDAFKGVDPNTTADDLFDFITVAIHPLNGKVYAGSFIEGLMEYDGETFTLYNEENSSLGNAQGDAQRTRIGGLTFDEDNNLWIANHAAEFPVSVLTNEGIWKKFKPSCNVNEVHQIAVDGSGFKWMASNNTGAGVIVFDEGDFEDPNDDRCRIFTSNNSELPTNSVNCLQADLNGDIWVGTTEGIIIFECGNSAYEPACVGSSRIFSEGGFNEALLNTEDVQTIAVDGANRKWIGTRNGVFVLSADGEEEIANFTAENSPLLNNNIVDIAINDLTGEVFIGTNAGIISYKSDATLGARAHGATATVYPNPVRPGYEGPIAIQGLSRDANVKITDITGRLVFETTALGGQAIWEGTDYTGRRVATGVYLVFSSDNSRTAGFGNPSSAVAKIVFVR